VSVSPVMSCNVLALVGGQGDRSEKVIAYTGHQHCNKGRPCSGSVPLGSAGTTGPPPDQRPNTSTAPPRLPWSDTSQSQSPFPPSGLPPPLASIWTCSAAHATVSWNSELWWFRRTYCIAGSLTFAWAGRATRCMSMYTTRHFDLT
jgi:hypothetical protein